MSNEEKPTRLAPIVTPDAKFFWEAADREELVCQRSRATGKFLFPPRPMCPDTHSVDIEVAQLSGRGKVVSWVKPVHPPAFGFKEPPTVAVIELEEGVRFVTNVIDIAFEDITRDMPVEVCFVPTMNNHKVPVFRPAKQA